MHRTKIFLFFLLILKFIKFCKICLFHVCKYNNNKKNDSYSVFQETLCSIRQETPPRDLLRTPCTSPSTPHNLQTQVVQNWNSAGHLGSAGRTRGSAKKVPPEVPKRTSSITSRSMEPRHNGLSKSVENGSLSSVQSSGSDSTNCESSEGDAQRGSPVWKHKGIVSFSLFCVYDSFLFF